MESRNIIDYSSSSPPKFNGAGRSYRGSEEHPENALCDVGLLVLLRIRELEDTHQRLEEECNLLSKIFECYSNRMINVKTEINDAYVAAISLYGAGKLPSPGESNFSEAITKMIERQKGNDVE